MSNCSTYYIKIPFSNDQLLKDVAKQNQIELSSSLVTGHFSRGENLYVARMTAEEATMIKMSVPTTGFLNFTRIWKTKPKQELQ